MNTDAQDVLFAGHTLHGAIVAVTFRQDARVLSHEIDAIHTDEASGKETRFLIQICDEARRRDFTAGVGAAIQADFVAKCQEVFERRRTNAPGSHDTPDTGAVARTLVVMGFWDTSRSDVLIFQLAAWSWKNANGDTIKDGWIPKNATNSGQAAA